MASADLSMPPTGEIVDQRVSPSPTGLNHVFRRLRRLWSGVNASPVHLTPVDETIHPYNLFACEAFSQECSSGNDVERRCH